MMPRQLSKEYIFRFFEALALYRYIFCQSPPPPAQTPPKRAATKSDIREAVKTILRGEDVPDAKPGPRGRRTGR